MRGVCASGFGSTPGIVVMPPGATVAPSGVVPTVRLLGFAARIPIKRSRSWLRFIRRSCSWMRRFSRFISSF